MVPRYTTNAGWSSELGHGPGRMEHATFVARPFIHRRGEPFRPHAGGGFGVASLAGTYVGSNHGLDGVVILAPGYSAKWEWDLRNLELNLDPDRFLLDPLPPSEREAELLRVGRLLEGREIVGQDAMLWSHVGVLDVRLTPEERALVRDFVARHVRACSSPAPPAGSASVPP